MNLFNILIVVIFLVLKGNFPSYFEQDMEV
mgnify:CR=1 FL=1